MLVVFLSLFSLERSTELIGLAHAQVVGSGVLKEESLAVAAFGGVEVSGVFRCTFTEADEHSVVLRGDDNIVPLVVVEVTGSTLTARMRDNTSVATKLPLELLVATPRLTSVRAEGACVVEVGASTTALLQNLEDVRLAGVSRLNLASLGSPGFRLVGTGASQATLSGAVGKAAIELSGSSKAEAGDLLAQELRVEIDGASSATVQALGSLSGVVSGASSLLVRGKPSVESVRTSGASSVRHESAP